MFQKAIREGLRNKGIKQILLAEKSGIHRQSLSRFLKGKSGISFKALEKMLEVLGITLKVPKK